ncbi:MAG: hypothetical protein ACLTAY_10815 [Thomasclavelia ramosa]
MRYEILEEVDLNKLKNLDGTLGAVPKRKSSASGYWKMKLMLFITILLILLMEHQNKNQILNFQSVVPKVTCFCWCTIHWFLQLAGSGLIKALLVVFENVRII